jgi:hypothetical protein
MLAHNLTMAAVNNTTREQLMTLDAEQEARTGVHPHRKLIWTTHPEMSKKGPCSICDSLNGNEYDPSEIGEIDYLPGEVHPTCYCTWTISVAT